MNFEIMVASATALALQNVGEEHTFEELRPPRGQRVRSVMFVWPSG